METEKDFNFELVGKRMPYSMPEGFLERMEGNVMNEIQMRRKRTLMWRRVSGALLAVAAVTVLALIVRWKQPQTESCVPTPDLAYRQLSSEDQEFLKEVYEEDVFINNNICNDEL